MSQTSLDDKQRMQVNMSGLKSSSMIHQGCGDPGVAIKDAKIFVDFILNHNKREGGVESSAPPSTSSNQSQGDNTILVCIRNSETVNLQEKPDRRKRLKDEFGFDFTYGKDNKDPHWRKKIPLEDWKKMQADPVFKDLKIWTNNRGGAS